MQQFRRYIGNLLQGDLGISTRHGRPVTDLLTERLPWIADELVILQDGRVVERGPAVDIAAAPAEEYSRRLLNTRLSPLGVRS